MKRSSGNNDQKKRNPGGSDRSSRTSKGSGHAPSNRTDKKGGTGATSGQDSAGRGAPGTRRKPASTGRNKPASAGGNRPASTGRNKPVSADRNRPASTGRNKPAPGSGKSASGSKGRIPKDNRRGSSEGKTELIRLNKYIAHAGISSRREADKLIVAGLISVNGKIVTEVGTKVNPADDVRYNGERLGNERKVYLLLNKPKDYVTTVDDPHAKKTVMELIDRACKERIYPVGRLDRNTTGVLLFTNDGDLTRRLTHPSFNKKKIYHVFLDRNLTHAELNTIAAGIELDDGIIKVDAIAYASMENKREIGIEIHSGKNRVVRRIFEKMGHNVTKLDRVYFAGLTKKNLPRGRWRFLSEKEIKMLKMNAFE